MWLFLAALVALNAFAFLLRDERLVGTAAILGLNWCICTAAVYATGEEYPVVVFVIADYLAAFTILVVFPLDGRRTNLWEGVVGFLYGVEMVIHAARSISGSQSAIYHGWNALEWLSWGQVLVAVGWGAYVVACRRGFPLGRLSNLDPLLGGYRSRVDEKAR